MLNGDVMCICILHLNISMRRINRNNSVMWWMWVICSLSIRCVLCRLVLVFGWSKDWAAWFWIFSGSVGSQMSHVTSKRERDHVGGELTLTHSTLRNKNVHHKIYRCREIDSYSRTDEHTGNIELTDNRLTFHTPHTHSLSLDKGEKHFLLNFCLLLSLYYCYYWINIWRGLAIFLVKY